MAVIPARFDLTGFRNLSSLAVRALENNPLLLNDVNPVHSDQRIYVVEINGYPHAAPYEIRADVHWLITVYSARKYKR